jgi:DNA-binding transcriptional regulator LsrR (DeoR family)
MDSGDFLLAQIAKLYYVDKVKQNEIAKRFDITPMMVSRYLRRAEQRNIVSVHIKMPWSQDLGLGQDVMERYHLKECVALDIPEDADIPSYIGKYAADYFASIIKQDMVIGISWGKTISEFVAAMPFLQVDGCTLLQLSGAFLADETKVMPTSILQQMAHRLGAKSFAMSSPLYVSSPQVKESLIQEPFNQIVMELSEHADLAIIGASSLKREATTMILNPVTLDAFEEMRQLGVIGDLAGVFLDAQGQSVQWSKSSLYMGIPLSQIAKAKDVVCLAGEVDKAPILCAGARKGFIKTLITSKKTAEAMLKA